MEDAVVVLADPQTEIFKALEKSYMKDAEHYVLPHEIIQQSIDRGYFHLDDKPTYKNPGGRRPGEEYGHYSVEFKLSILIPVQKDGIYRRRRSKLVYVDSKRDTV
jgi:hypothetical protein